MDLKPAERDVYDNFASNGTVGLVFQFYYFFLKTVMNFIANAVSLNRDKLEKFLRNNEARFDELQVQADEYVPGRGRRRGGRRGQQDSHFSSILTLLLRLQQCSVLPYLIHTVIFVKIDLLIFSWKLNSCAFEMNDVFRMLSDGGGR